MKDKNLLHRLYTAEDNGLTHLQPVDAITYHKAILPHSLKTSFFNHEKKYLPTWVTEKNIVPCPGGKFFPLRFSLNPRLIPFLGNSRPAALYSKNHNPQHRANEGLSGGVAMKVVDELNHESIDEAIELSRKYDDKICALILDEIDFNEEETKKIAKVLDRQNVRLIYNCPAPGVIPAKTKAEYFRNLAIFNPKLVDITTEVIVPLDNGAVVKSGFYISGNVEREAALEDRIHKSELRHFNGAISSINSALESGILREAEEISDTELRAKILESTTAKIIGEVEKTATLAPPTAITRLRSKKFQSASNDSKLVTAAQFERYIKYLEDIAKDTKSDLCNLSHSNASETRAEKLREIAAATLDPKEIRQLCGVKNEIDFSELIELIREKMCLPMGLTDAKSEHITLVPQTTLLAIKLLLGIFREEALEEFDTPPNGFVAFYPSGCYRKVDANEHLSGGVKTGLIDVNEEGKMTPENFESAILDAKKRGVMPLSLIFEAPTNPGMVTYSKEEMASLNEVAKKYGIKVIHDGYFLGTEAEDSIQSQFPDSTIIIAPRRFFGADSMARAASVISSDSELTKKLQDRISASTLCHDEGTIKAFAAILKTIDAKKVLEQRRELKQARDEAAEEIKKIPGLRVITEAKVGPFLNIGFTKDVEEKLKEISPDNYTDAAYLAEMVGVLAIPSIASFSKERGFRINVASNPEVTKKAIARLATAIEYIKEGRPFDMKKFRETCHEADEAFGHSLSSVSAVKKDDVEVEDSVSKLQKKPPIKFALHSI